MPIIISLLSPPSIINVSFFFQVYAYSWALEFRTLNNDACGHAHTHHLLTHTHTQVFMLRGTCFMKEINGRSWWNDDQNRLDGRNHPIRWLLIFILRIHSETNDVDVVEPLPLPLPCICMCYSHASLKQKSLNLMDEYIWMQWTCMNCPSFR